MQNDNDEVITFRGNRDVWIDFVSKVKKKRKTVWDVLEELLKKSISEP